MSARKNGDWASAKLSEVIELFDYKRVPLNSRERHERQGPYPYYGAQGIIDHVDGYLFDGRYILVAEDGENLNSRKLPLAMFANGKFWVNNHAHIIRARPEVADDVFLLACLNQTDIKPFVTGAAQPKLSQANLKLIEIPLPPIVVQRRIAAIVSAYDDLIENNLRRIKNLEEMALALYRKWFIEFSFPGHAKVSRVASAIGPIPKGWQVKAIPEAIEINPRVSISGDGKHPFVPMACLANDSMLITEIETRVGSSGSKFQNGDTLFARITPCLENGKTGFVQFLPDRDSVACGSTEFIVLRPRTVTPEFVYLLARSEEFRATAIKSMSGASGRQRVQERCFDSFQIAEPPHPLLERFSAVVAPSFALIQRLHLESDNLRQTRELLLPRLLSGQVLTAPREMVKI